MNIREQAKSLGAGGYLLWRRNIKRHAQSLLRVSIMTGMVEREFMGLQRNKCEIEVMVKDLAH